MAKFNPINFASGDTLYADQLNAIQSGVATIDNTVSRTSKNMALVIEDYQGAVNLFDYHPWLIPDRSYGEHWNYDAEDNAVYGTGTALTRKFKMSSGESPIPLLLKPNNYYTFKGKIKAQPSDGASSWGMFFELEFDDGYTWRKYFENTGTEYADFTFTNSAMSDHGTLVNVYAGYSNDGACVWYIKDFMVHERFEEKPYEKTPYISTAVDHVARQSMDELLNTIGVAMNGTFDKVWDAANGNWKYTFTPNG